MGVATLVAQASTRFVQPERQIAQQMRCCRVQRRWLTVCKRQQQACQLGVVYTLGPGGALLETRYPSRYTAQGYCC